MRQHAGFIAYPDSPPEVSSAIRDAVERANAAKHSPSFQSWEHSDVSGRPLMQPIVGDIEHADVLVADVTRLNFNVTYEVGYAIGLGKRVLLVRHSAIAADDALVLRAGIFDTLGYEPYADSAELAGILQRTTDLTPLRTDSETDTKAPVYLLETPVRTSDMTRIVARVKRARLFYRSFTPSEDARLSAIDAIRHVSKSIGVLAPLLSPEFEDAPVHNIRAAFVAGLAHGMGKETLVLQSARYATPLDLRDAAETYQSLDDINRHVERFAGDVYEVLQKTDAVGGGAGSQLQRVSLGDPMAENEFQSLASYYVQTDEYDRAARGEVNLVVGRKGTGKTALFFQVRDKVRRNKQNIVVDLKPEGYQLLKLKEQVLDLISEGAKAHLVTAFWEYLLLLEICRKVLEKDRLKHRYDYEMAEEYRELERLYSGGPGTGEGDFSERLLVLSQDIIDRYKKKYGTRKGVRLTSNEVTNLLHTTSIFDLRSELSGYLGRKEQVLVLFDNLDKGWSYSGIEEGDILMLRCLIDAARKVQRDMRNSDIPISCIVFVRNDIYQLLMDSSPDFGKEARASLDWDDADLLRELLRRRLTQTLPGEMSFEQAWGLLCVSHYEGQESSQFMIDRCLMRPRNLLKLVGYCKGFAVNLNHEKIEANDIAKGLRSYSNDLLVEADRELADVEPSAKELLYQFLGEPSEVSEEDLTRLLTEHGIAADKVESVTDFLLYLGFHGVRVGQDDTRYIYHVGYDLRILKALRRKNRDRSMFVLNSAFWPALEVVPLGT